MLGSRDSPPRMECVGVYPFKQLSSSATRSLANTRFAFDHLKLYQWKTWLTNSEVQFRCLLGQRNIKSVSF